jgi:hypothetical protein
MPIPLANDFASLSGHLQGFSGHVNGLLQNVDGEAREVISSLLKVWEQNFGELQTVFPAAMNDIQSNIAQVQNQHREIRANIATTKSAVAKAQEAQTAAAAAKKAAPKTPALKPIDTELGIALRDELLERFGVAADMPSEQLPEAIHEIWEDWKFESWEQN